MQISIIIRNTLEDILEDLKYYLPNLNSNGIGRVEDKIEERLKEFADKIQKEK